MDSTSFPPNPAAVTVKNRRTAVTEPLPGGGEWLTVTGTAPREVTLEGQLWAEDAAAALRRYEELRKLYEAGGTQVLCVPGHPPFYALFTALTLEAQGDETGAWTMPLSSWKGANCCDGDPLYPGRHPHGDRPGAGGRSADWQAGSPAAQFSAATCPGRAGPRNWSPSAGRTTRVLPSSRAIWTPLPRCWTATAPGWRSPPGAPGAICSITKPCPRAMTR